MTAAVEARPKMRVFPGERRQVARARDFVGRTLAGLPVADDVVLLTSELVTNAIVHTASGGDGGRFVVTIRRGKAEVRVEVWDAGALTDPVVQSLDQDRESGVGLSLVEMIATRWGHDSERWGRRVWFEIECR